MAAKKKRVAKKKRKAVVPRGTVKTDVSELNTKIAEVITAAAIPEWYNGAGRPSLYKPEYAQIAKFICSRREATDQDLAECFGVSIATISLWKKVYEDFSDAVVTGKIEPNERVERSLFERAIGYEHPEEKVFQYEGGIITHEVTRHYPPEPSSIKFWLMNRDPKRWRVDSRSDVELGEVSLEAILDRIHAKKQAEKTA